MFVCLNIIAQYSMKCVTVCVTQLRWVGGLVYLFVLVTCMWSICTGLGKLNVCGDPGLGVWAGCACL